MKPSLRQRLRACLSPEASRRSYYLLYTGFFLLLALFAFGSLLLQNKSLIWKYDGWDQHYRALRYYGEYLRQILQSLFTQGRPVIPDWNFYIGEGSDVMNALHYYVMGDPLALLSVLVPPEGTHILFSCLCVLRMYLAGFAFSALALGTGKRNRLGILAGALSYCFCTWALLNAARHPYFLSPMICFPWMLLGIEKIIRRERPYVFISAAAISAASNFYFFYMIVILAVAYALLRLAFVFRRDLKTALLTLLRMGLMAVIGVCIAGLVLAPVMLMFLQDSRAGVTQPFHLFYPWSYYSALFDALLSFGDPFWLCMGYSAPVVLALCSLFVGRRRQGFLRLLLILCLLIVVFPILGRLLNGMSYMANRWSWALGLLCAYILTAEWEHLFQLRPREWLRLLLCCLGIYLGCFLLVQSRSSAAFSALPLLFIGLLPLGWTGTGNRPLLRQLCLFGVALCSILRCAVWFYTPGFKNYSSSLVKNSQVQELADADEAALLAELTHTWQDFYPRFTGRNLTPNANLTNQISSTQYFWTVSNPYVNRFREDMQLVEPLYSSFQHYDDRRTLIALSASGYYVADGPATQGLPYGLELLGQTDLAWDKLDDLREALRQELGEPTLSEEQEQRLSDAVSIPCYVYENTCALPLSYSYSRYVTRETWEALDPVQRQELMLRAVLLEDSPEALQPFTETMPDYTLPYELECDSPDLTESETGFITTASNVQLTLRFDAVKNAEIYLQLEGLEITRTPGYDLYLGDETVDPQNLYNQVNWELLTPSAQRSLRLEKRNWNPQVDLDLKAKAKGGPTKTLSFLSADASFSSGRQDYLINLGSSPDGIRSLTLTLPAAGRYDLTALRVYAVPEKGFKKQVAALGKHHLTELRMDTDYLSGEILLEEPRLLVLAIPYSTGWSALVNGTEQPLLLANEHYLGLELPAGWHKVELRYSTPYKHQGMALTALGFAALLICVVVEERRRRRPGKRSIQAPNERR